MTDTMATYRLTHLVVDDEFPPVAAARVAVLRRAKADGTAEYFVSCYWCVSFWVALVVVAARRFAPRMWDPLATALAFSAVTGLASER